MSRPNPSPPPPLPERGITNILPTKLGKTQTSMSSVLICRSSLPLKIKIAKEIVQRKSDVVTFWYMLWWSTYKRSSVEASRVRLNSCTGIHRVKLNVINMSTSSRLILSKHEALTQYWANVVPPSWGYPLSGSTVIPYLEIHITGQFT